MPVVEETDVVSDDSGEVEINEKNHQPIKSIRDTALCNFAKFKEINNCVARPKQLVRTLLVQRDKQSA